MSNVGVIINDMNPIIDNIIRTTISRHIYLILITLAMTHHWIARKLALHNFSKCTEHPSNILVRQIRMNRRNIDTREFHGHLLDFLDLRHGLWGVVRPTKLDKE